MSPRAAEPSFATIEAGLASLAAGRPVLVLDDESRENEGDVILAATHATASWVGWAVRHTSGVLCAPMTGSRADRLQLPPMVENNEDPRRTAYTVSVDARVGIGTGISAADRARTLRLLADEETEPGDLVRPGHVFPLRAVDGGVLARPGHTEAAVDLCRLAGLPAVGVIAELVTDTGAVMRRADVLALGAGHEIPVVTIEQLARHLRRSLRTARDDASEGSLAYDESVPGSGALAERVARVAETSLPTEYGVFRALGYRDRHTGREHVALVSGNPKAPDAVVRVHSECLTGDTFGSLRCDCGQQLHTAMVDVAIHGGVVVYLRGHEGRGVGLAAKLAAYRLQEAGRDTVDANVALGLPVDAREYGAAAAILDDLGLRRVRLLTNNPAKVAALQTHGITVVARVPLLAADNEWSRSYLQTKRDRMGHVLPGVSA